MSNVSASLNDAASLLLWFAEPKRTDASLPVAVGTNVLLRVPEGTFVHGVNAH